MNAFTRINRLMLLPMVFILPLWLVLGRALFGSYGWGTIIYFFTVAPILLVSLLILGFLVKVNKTPDGRGYLSIYDSSLLTALYTAVFLHGFFIVDGGDTEESLNSVATKILGKSFQGTSEALGAFFFYIAALILTITFIVFLYERAKKPLD